MVVSWTISLLNDGEAPYRNIIRILGRFIPLTFIISISLLSIIIIADWPPLFMAA